MRKLWLIIPAVFLLSGCGMSLEGRAELRDECRELGGVYTEWTDGFKLGIHGDCNLGEQND